METLEGRYSERRRGGAGRRGRGGEGPPEPRELAAARPARAPAAAALGAGGRVAGPPDGPRALRHAVVAVVRGRGVRQHGNEAGFCGARRCHLRDRHPAR